MKRSISITLVLAMLFSLMIGATGCGGSNEKEKFVGKWQAEVDFTDLINESFAEDEEMAEYLNVSEFNLAMDFIFNEDDTYEIGINEESFNEAVAGIGEDFKAGMERYFEDAIAAEGLEMTVDEFCAAAGFDFNAFIDELTKSFDFSTVADEAHAEGKYEVENGKLYTSDSKETAVSKTAYETYEFDGENLKIIEMVGAEPDEFAATLYPITLKKVQ